MIGNILAALEAGTSWFLASKTGWPQTGQAGGWGISRRRDVAGRGVERARRKVLPVNLRVRVKDELVLDAEELSSSELVVHRRRPSFARLLWRAIRFTSPDGLAQRRRETFGGSCRAAHSRLCGSRWLALTLGDGEGNEERQEVWDVRGSDRPRSTGGVWRRVCPRLSSRPLRGSPTWTPPCTRRARHGPHRASLGPGSAADAGRIRSRPDERICIRSVQSLRVIECAYDGTTRATPGSQRAPRSEARIVSVRGLIKRSSLPLKLGPTFSTPVVARSLESTPRREDILETGRMHTSGGTQRSPRRRDFIPCRAGMPVVRTRCSAAPLRSGNSGSGLRA
jgi:hypothetical protein